MCYIVEVLLITFFRHSSYTKRINNKQLYAGIRLMRTNKNTDIHVYMTTHSKQDKYTITIHLDNQGESFIKCFTSRWL